MVNRRCVVEAFLVFTMLADFGLAIRSLHSQVRIVNGECHFRGSDLKQGYLTLKDGRCYEAACVPGEGRAVFRLVRQCGRSDYGRYCWVSDGYLSTRCCHQAVLCQ
ncbi:uncharacterized protein LOC125945178 [Dermacentor silvarum]|uniref:uncharacterized protein LOC125945178 n=1 Tax=Dermacentor silvarum TaxID=543639 RepID=UPI002101989E|nr:uncharacterized protein LOC125945178 [Dermacentor silvarum]